MLSFDIQSKWVWKLKWGGITAGKTLMFDRDEMIQLADKKAIAVVAV